MSSLFLGAGYTCWSSDGGARQWTCINLIFWPLHQDGGSLSGLLSDEQSSALQVKKSLSIMQRHRVVPSTFLVM
jgi:hypothetical protein